MAAGAHSSRAERLSDTATRRAECARFVREQPLFVAIVPTSGQPPRIKGNPRICATSHRSTNSLIKRPTPVKRRPSIRTAARGNLPRSTNDEDDCNPASLVR